MKFRRLANKYVIAGLFALVWMTFFDNYNLLSQAKMAEKVADLQTDKQFYQRQIERLRRQQQLLAHQPDEVERIAREVYLMKRPNEDLYLTEEADSLR